MFIHIIIICIFLIICVSNICISESKASFIQRRRWPLSAEEETGGHTEWRAGVYQESELLWCENAMGKEHTAPDGVGHY